MGAIGVPCGGRLVIPTAQAEFVFAPLLTSPYTGEEQRLPPRTRGGLGVGARLNLYAEALIRELWSCDWYYFLRRRSPSRLTNPVPMAIRLPGSGAIILPDSPSGGMA